MNRIKRYLSIPLMIVLVTLTIGADKCDNKKPPDYAPYARIAVGTLKDVTSIFKANGADTTKLELGIKVGESLVKAFETNSTDILTIAAEFITAFEAVVSDVDVISDPSLRTKILVALAVGNIALRTIAELVKANTSPEIIAAAESDAPRRGAQKATPLEIVVEFAGKPVWRCRSSVNGRFLPMGECKANPATTTVERAR